MTLKTRKQFFYISIITFILLAFFIIPYSNGWRFDFNTLSFVKLGGLYFNIEPAGSQVKVDKLSFEINSGFLKNDILIANLFPKTYHVSVQKEGYQSWNKNLIVKPSLVTNIYPVILVPQKSTEKLLIEKIEDYFPNSNYLAWKNMQGKLEIDNKIIKGTEFISWLINDKSALVYDGISKNYFIINPAQNNSALNINLVFENLKYQKNINDKYTIKKIINNPTDKNKVIIMTGKTAYLMDFNKPSLENINIASASTTAVKIPSGNFTSIYANNDLLLIADSANLYQYNLNKKEGVILLKQEGITSLETSPNNQFIAFYKNNQLFLFDQTKPNEKILSLGSDINYFKFSPDNKKLATVSGNIIKIYFIGDDYELFNKKIMGSSIFEITSVDQERPIAWYSNSSYLLVKSGANLRLLELNDEQPINIQTISTDIDKYFYEADTNQIRFIKNNSLYEILE